MLRRIVKDSLSPLKHIVIIMIGFSSQAETNAFLPIVFHSPGKAGEKQKTPRITIWLYCCSYSDQQSPLESFIDWLNTWHLWGISGINYFSFFFSKRLFFYSGFWSPSGKRGGQWARVTTSGWRGQSWNDVQGGDEASGKTKGCYGTSKWYLS